MNDMSSNRTERENSVKLLYRALSAGGIRHLDSRENHRLFFLLEGNVSLKTTDNDECILRGREFVLLPPANIIYCSALEDSRCVVINCIRLKINGNSSYWEELREQVETGITVNRPIPIRGWFLKVLEDFAFYPVSEDMYPPIYDMVFIIMRALYSQEEMLSLFLPVLRKE